MTVARAAGERTSCLADVMKRLTLEIEAPEGFETEKVLHAVSRLGGEGRITETASDSADQRQMNFDWEFVTKRCDSKLEPLAKREHVAGAKLPNE